MAHARLEQPALIALQQSALAQHQTPNLTPHAQVGVIRVLDMRINRVQPLRAVTVLPASMAKTEACPSGSCLAADTVRIAFVLAQ